MIADTLVPHSLWTIDDTQGSELIPLESVVGIIEVKRTLTGGALRDAVIQLQDITCAVGVSKYNDEALLPGGIPVGPSLTSPYRSNPLLGIISVTADNNYASEPGTRVAQAVSRMSGGRTVPPLELDMALSLDGSLVATRANSEGASYAPLNTRQPDLAYGWVECSARFGRPPRVAAAFGIGFLLAYLAKACGRQADVNGYFFNKTLEL